jgi:3-oxoacyl-[acyl-carrier protein] reductase
MTMDLGLAGAAVAVNGGSKGMGRAAAEAIAAEGARVAVLATASTPTTSTTP